MDYSKTKYINQNFGTICHTEVYLTFSRFEAENFQKNSIKFNLKRNSTPADNSKKNPYKSMGTFDFWSKAEAI